MVFALGFPSEVEGKALLLKKSHTVHWTDDLSWV